MHAASVARCALKSVPRSPAGSSSGPSSPSRTSGRCTPTPLCGIPPLALPKQALPRAAAALAALSLASSPAAAAVDAPPATAAIATATAPPAPPPAQEEEMPSSQVPLPPPVVDPIEAENEALAEFVSWLIANGEKRTKEERKREKLRLGLH